MGTVAEDKAKEFVGAQKEIAKAFEKDMHAMAPCFGLMDEDVDMCLYYIAGMPSWQAFQRAYDYDTHEPLQVVRERADKLLRSKDYAAFCAYARRTAQERYNADLRQYDWKFEDSVMELRFLIDASHEQLSVQKGVLPQNTTNTILKAVQELNKMYEFSGSFSNLGKVKAVIFAGEDDLED